MPTSIGHGWQKGPRNSPTVLNAVFNEAQFWDGRAADLAEQAKGPVQAGVEMANTPANVVATLNSMPQYQDWIGQQFHELDMAAWTSNLPDDIGFGPQYVIFFRKDCEHCHELMELHFSGVLEHPTTAIAVPERDGFPTENLQPFNCPDCRLAELPAGIDWFLQTPVLVRLADGVVECAAEVEAITPECLVW